MFHRLALSFFALRNVSHESPRKRERERERERESHDFYIYIYLSRCTRNESTYRRVTFSPFPSDRDVPRFDALPVGFFVIHNVHARTRAGVNMRRVAGGFDRKI